MHSVIKYVLICIHFQNRNLNIGKRLTIWKLKTQTLEKDSKVQIFLYVFLLFIIIIIIIIYHKSENTVNSCKIIYIYMKLIFITMILFSFNILF